MTAAAPIAAKTVNALIVGAQADGVLQLVQPVAEVASTLAGGTGGLWVGGKATLWSDRLEFQPNAMNRAVHAGDVSAVLPLSAIRAVHDRFGVLSGIIEIETDRASAFKLRCFGSKTFSAQIRQAVAAA